MTFIESTEQLAALYGEPPETSLVKVTNYITDEYRQSIEASPFVALATSGPEGLDCSPRGDVPGFVRIANPRQVQLPDRRGNNRIDSLRNIVRDPRTALLFLIPGCDNTLRIIGRARISIDEELLKSFEVDGKQPRSVIVVDVQEVYFQCGRALIRSDLWNPDRHAARDSLPTPGTILANLSDHRVGGEAYDQEWPDRSRNTLW